MRGKLKRLVGRATLTGVLIAGASLVVWAPPASAAELTVNTTVDEYGSGGGCSLREAITAANSDAPFGGCPAGSGTDTIVLPAGTYELTRCGAEVDNSNGDLDITDESLTIAGGGATVRQTCGGSRVIEHSGEGVLTINQVTLTGGNNEEGTGVRGEGALTGTGLQIVNNPTDNDECCAGIYVDGDVNLTDSSVSNNDVTGGNCCAGIFADNITLVRTTVIDNDVLGPEADCCAGLFGDDITLIDSRVDDNDSDDDCCTGVFGSNITMVNSTVNNNDSFGDCCAGVFGQDITMENSEIIGNDALDDCCAGLFGGEVLLESSTVSNNIAGDADGDGSDCCAGIDADSLRAVNSTITGNVAEGDNCCGGINVNGAVELIYTTVAGNQSGDDSGTVVAGSLQSYGSLITGVGTLCVIGDGGSASDGYNLTGDDSCGLDEPTDGTVDDPLLGPLADNGGPTMTHLPAEGSPLIDYIPTADCLAGVDVDQRGVARPQFDGCDTGSVEVAPAPPPDSTPTTTTGTTAAPVGTLVTPRFTG